MVTRTPRELTRDALWKEKARVPQRATPTAGAKEPSWGRPRALVSAQALTAQKKDKELAPPREKTTGKVRVHSKDKALVPPRERLKGSRLARAMESGVGKGKVSVLRMAPSRGSPKEKEWDQPTVRVSVQLLEACLEIVLEEVKDQCLACL